MADERESEVDRLVRELQETAVRLAGTGPLNNSVARLALLMSVHMDYAAMPRQDRREYLADVFGAGVAVVKMFEREAEHGVGNV